MMLMYGLRSKSLEQAAAIVSLLLGVTFELHDSLFLGGDYFLAEMQEGTICIQPNYDAFHNETFQVSWPSDQFLLCFDGPVDAHWESYTLLLSSSKDAVFLSRSMG
ncbi:MAG: hypothetical protein AB7O65_10925 [Candidatus Korobacteraceae bacterium]